MLKLAAQGKPHSVFLAADRWFRAKQIGHHERGCRQGTHADCVLAPCCFAASLCVQQALCLQPRVASADVIQKFNPNNKNALIKQYKTIYHPGEVSSCIASQSLTSQKRLQLACCIFLKQKREHRVGKCHTVLLSNICMSCDSMNLHIICVSQWHACLFFQVNKIRECPQHPSVVVTHTDAPQLFVWSTERQPNRQGDKVQKLMIPA